MVLDGNVISGSMACCDNIDAGSMTAIVQCGGGSVVEPTMPPKTTPVQASPGSIIRAFEDDYKNKPAFWKDPLVLLKLSQIGVITDKKRNDLKNANSSGDCVCAAIMKDLRKWNCTMKEAKKFADLFKENYTSLYERMIVAFDTKQGDIAMQSVPDPIKSLIEKKDHDVRPRTSYGTRRSHGGGGVRPQTGRARTPQSPAEDEMVKAYVVKVAATNKVLAKTSDKVKEQEEIIEQYQVALQEYENKPTPINEEMSKWKMEFEELRSKYKEEKEENIKLKSKMAESEELVQNYKDENRQLRNECTINEDKLQQKDEALKKTQQELDHATQKVEYYKQLYVDMKCKVEALKDENAEMKHRLMKLENMMNRKSQQQEKLEFRMNALGLNRQLEFFNHSEKHVVRFLPEIPMMRK